MVSDELQQRHRGFGLSLSRDLFGRRGGKALRPAQRQRIEMLLPTLALPMAQKQAIEPTALFKGTTAERFWLEIGFGGGEHLAWQAAQHSDVGMIGAEFYLNGVATALKHIESNRVAERCRVHLGDGRDVMDKLADRSLERLFILHPDPWPKVRHWDRRIISKQTLDRAADLLVPGGELRMATDHADYQPWMMRVGLDHPAFAWCPLDHRCYTEQRLDWPTTRYQAKAQKEGRLPVYCSLIRL